MRYGIIIGDKPISNKKLDTNGSSNSALMEYKEGEPIVIGKAEDGRVMKQLSIASGLYKNDYILRIECSDPNALIDSFAILSVTGSIKMPYKDDWSYLPLTCTLSDLNSDYVLQNLLDWYCTYASITDTQKAMLLATPLCSITLTPSVYRGHNAILNLHTKTSVLDGIILTLQTKYGEGQVDKTTYTNIMTQVDEFTSKLSIRLTITYLVNKE